MIIFVKNTTMEKTENQTAVQWFYKELKNLIRESELTDMTPSKFTNKENQLIEQAKEMEKQQIIDAYDNGKYITSGKEFGGEQYYNKTFNR
jgi:hypothetical protein